MTEPAIDAKVADLLKSAAAYAETEPVYSLLLCRKVAESFLMRKHLEMIGAGDAKEVLTLGDAFSNKLGLKAMLSDFDIMSIQYIQNATNPFLHFRVDDLELPTYLIPRVLQEVRSLIGIEEYSDSNESELIEEIQDWRVILKSELDNFNWPVDLKNTIFEQKWLLNQLKKTTSVIESKKQKRQFSKDLRKKTSMLKTPELKQELVNRNLQVRRSKSDLIERVINEFKRGTGTGVLSNEIKSLEEKRIGLEQIILLDEAQRFALLRECTEAALISLYNNIGKKNWNSKKNLTSALRGAFYAGIKSVIPRLKLSNKALTKKWNFILEKTGKGYRLKPQWDFFEIR